MDNPCLDIEFGEGGYMTGSVKSDGGSSSYYKFVMPATVGELVVPVTFETHDVIRYMVDNDFDLGNLVKASRRISEARKGTGKEGTDELYDWNKIKHTAEKNIKRLEGMDTGRNR